MADTLRLAIAQLNPTVGDLDGNVALAIDALNEATEAGADVVILPEMVITGYPPEDLVLKPGFLADVRAAVEKFAAGTGRTAAVVGFADGGENGGSRDVWNAVAVCAGLLFDHTEPQPLPLTRANLDRCIGAPYVDQQSRAYVFHPNPKKRKL